MSPLRRKGFVLVGLIATGLLSLAALTSFFGRKRLRFTYLTGVMQPSAYQALAAKPGWVASQLSVAPGIRLNGLVRRPHVPDAPWVLFYQGNDRAMLRVGQAFLSRLAGDQDWGLAIYAYRGYNSSDGVPRLSDLAADAPQILEALCSSQHVDRGRVHLVGFSIGGHLAVRAMESAARLQPKPASLTLLAAADDIVMVRSSFYERLDPGDELQTRPYLDAIPAPVLVVQGTADEALLGPAQGRDISAKLGERARYVELEGVGHTALLDDPTSIAKVREFILDHSK